MTQAIRKREAVRSGCGSPWTAPGWQIAITGKGTAADDELMIS